MERYLHPRNRHQNHYDFAVLTQLCPELSRFVSKAKSGQLSIDFANAAAVKALNKALIIHYYDFRDWDIPEGYLCPPIPGRSDYIHAIADLLAESNVKASIPTGDAVRGLDIGVGTSCIYPLIGHGEYGWSFVGSDIDPVAIESARKFLESNPKLSESVELRLQKSKENFFQGVIQSKDRFDFTVCNPPFHASQEEAAEGSQRKWRNLSLSRDQKRPRRGGQVRDLARDQTLNFGGKANELWYPGGEVAFIRGMIQESGNHREQVRWFTTLLSKEAHLPVIEPALIKCGATHYRAIELSQGQKKSRIVAWTFQA